QNKDGTLMATLRYRGPDVAMMSFEACVAYLEGWNRFMRRLGSGWALWADEWHEPATNYPQSTWSTPAAGFVDTLRKVAFESGDLFGTDQFLTLTWLPPSSRRQYWYDSIWVT